MTLNPYRHPQTAGVNPIAAAAGVGDPYVWAMGVPGALTPTRTDIPAGWVPCLTRVMECPWTEDEAGVEIDTGAVWAVQTRWTHDGDGGEEYRYTMVPRVLPMGYTPRGRNHVVPHIYDHLGENPMLGVVEWDGMNYVDRPVRWRTPTGQYPPDLNGDGYLWVPMNLNQQIISLPAGVTWSFAFSEADNSGVASGFTGPGCSTPVTAGPNLTRGWNYYNIGRHVGFRGGKMKFYLYDNATCSPFNSGSFKIVIGHSSVVPETDELPPDIEFSGEYQFSDLVNIGSGGGYNWRFELEVDLPEMAPSPTATPPYWIAFAGSCQAGSGSFLLEYIKLSPRHDVPLWYWSSTRNRVAPGGVILPP